MNFSTVSAILGFRDSIMEIYLLCTVVFFISTAYSICSTANDIYCNGASPKSTKDVII